MGWLAGCFTLISPDLPFFQPFFITRSGALKEKLSMDRLGFLSR